MTALLPTSDLAATRPASLSAAERSLLLFLFVALICARVPSVLLQGRFFAEEGPFFFAYAWHMPWTAALFHNIGGYLNIVASSATLVAALAAKHGWISLEHAPYVTEAVGLLFQTFPAVLILSSKADWLAPRWARPLALLILATPPLTEQVWLHSLHCQFELAVCAGLILATETGGPRALVGFRFILLFLGPLCGPSAILMLPFFLARAALERGRERILQAAVLALATALQLGLFYIHTDSRGFGLAPPLLATILLLRHIVLPFLGHDVTMSIAGRLYETVKLGATPWAPAALGVAAIGLALAFVARRWRETPAWLLVPALTLAAVAYEGAIHTGPAMLDIELSTRYAFAPQVFIGFALIAIAAGRGREARYAGIAALWIAGMGLTGYFRPLADMNHGADWRSEVALWRADPEHRLVAWPDDWWFVDLSPSSVPCPADPKAKDAPDYCDQYWEKLQADAFDKFNQTLAREKAGGAAP